MNPSLWPALLGAGMIISLMPGAGAVNTMSNALIPQFIRPEQPLLTQYGVLAATVVVIDVLVMWFFYAGAARSFRRFTRNESGQRILNRTFGSLFVGVGAVLALA